MKSICNVYLFFIVEVLLTILSFFFSEIFSRVAVICLTLGIIILLAMIIVAIYRSIQSKQLMKGSGKMGQGMVNNRMLLGVYLQASLFCSLCF